MRINTKPADLLALSSSLAATTAHARCDGESLAQRVGLMPYIGVGTFLVASYLRSSLRAHQRDGEGPAGPDPQGIATGARWQSGQVTPGKLPLT